MFREYLSNVVAVVTVVLILALVGGTVLGQPVLLSFVTSDSMAPTIQAGDGFVAIPQPLSGDINPGDIVVFSATDIQGGELTTHRVVRETDNGYITQGDANPFTDQGDGASPVTEDQIVATAWQPGDQILTIPALGTVVVEARAMIGGVLATALGVIGIENAGNPEQVGSILLVVGLLLFIATLAGSIQDTSRTRSRGAENQIQARYVAIFLMVIALIPANAAMLLSSSTQQISLDTAISEENIAPGEPVEVSLSAENDGYATMLVILTAPPDTTVTDEELAVSGRSTASTSLTVPAPPPNQRQSVAVSEQRYVLLLPQSMLTSLHNIHPVLALAAINALLIFGIATFVFGVFGVGKRYQRNTDRQIPLSLRLKRLLP